MRSVGTLPSRLPRLAVAPDAGLAVQADAGLAVQAGALRVIPVPSFRGLPLVGKGLRPRPVCRSADAIQRAGSGADDECCTAGGSRGQLAALPCRSAARQLQPDGDLTSLYTNMVVMQILDAARESARTGRTIVLHPLPQ